MRRWGVGSRVGTCLNAHWRLKDWGLKRGSVWTPLSVQIHVPGGVGGNSGYKDIDAPGAIGSLAGSSKGSECEPSEGSTTGSLTDSDWSTIGSPMESDGSTTASSTERGMGS